MNLTKLALVSCPLVLAAVVLVSGSAEANSLNSSQAHPISVPTDYHAMAGVVDAPSDRPLIPTGCSCARCTRTEELLQGQFPAF